MHETQAQALDLPHLRAYGQDIALPSFSSMPTLPRSQKIDTPWETSGSGSESSNWTCCSTYTIPPRQFAKEIKMQVLQQKACQHQVYGDMLIPVVYRGPGRGNSPPWLRYSMSATRHARGRARVIAAPGSSPRPAMPVLSGASVCNPCYSRAAVTGPGASAPRDVLQYRGVLKGCGRLRPLLMPGHG